MPFYDYRCEACGHTFEAMQKISDAVLTLCPECGNSALKKQLTAPVFRLKGGGWYETDFKSGNKKNLHDSSKEEKSKSDKGEKSDTKQAKKEASVAPAAS